VPAILPPALALCSRTASHISRDSLRQTRAEPLASAEPEQVVALISPTLQRYVDG
jgi:hypothetical protein